MKERLDVLLVQQGYAPSREKEKAIIMSGSVFVNGQREDKAGTSFDSGKIAYDIPMSELFEKEDELKKMGLEIPLAVRVRNRLRERGIDLGKDVVNVETLIGAALKIYAFKNSNTNGNSGG